MMDPDIVQNGARDGFWKCKKLDNKKEEKKK